MGTLVFTRSLELSSGARTALRATARLWFLIAFAGQLLFAFTVASWYGIAALRGSTPHAWSRFISRGHVPGDTAGNTAVAVHLALAVLITVGGGLQLIHPIRTRFPRFHRWNGRIYIVIAFVTTLAGLYMMWIRGSVGDLSQHVANSLSGLLIMAFAVLTVRSAMRRDMRAHRRWALRLFMVVSSSWFFRVGLFLILAINRGPIGFDPVTFRGPLLTFMAFAQYLVPLSILELYLRTEERTRTRGHLAMAGLLLCLTLTMTAGIAAVTAAVWLPNVRSAWDGRTSIAETLSETIDARGIDAAVKQYARLKAADAQGINFEESQLNTLGYRLLRAGKTPEAIRIFQLNADAYPRSSNAVDSLAEAWLMSGHETEAIAHYRRAVMLDPRNGNSIHMLEQLHAAP